MNSDQPEDSKSSMSQRGVTRPMALGLMEREQEENHKHRMSENDKLSMLIQHHRKTLWIYWTLMVLGVWMLAAPLTFSFTAEVVQPAGDRSVWLDIMTRIRILQISDIFCGFLLIYFGWTALRPNRPFHLWMACATGIWLNLAPLIFWAPNPLIYLNDTLVGTLVIALTILIPGMPNMIHYMEMGPQMPKGWSYNPSSWTQRSILIFLGFAGWIVSRYLAAFQLGYISHAWDPFFGNSSRQVLTSQMSRSLPISDGGLGALAYTFEFLMAWMGSPSRWRTMPWMVTLFGILVIPLGLVHIFLVISQPVTVGYWCTFCLLAAALMLPMIPLEVDEVVAMVQFMKQSTKKGIPFWKTFWKGGSVEGEGMDHRSPAMATFPDKKADVFRSSIWGMSFPWTLVTSAVIGIWLMASPGIFQSAKSVANVGHLVGALILTTAVIAMGEVIRSLRFLNVILGAVLVSSSFILTQMQSAETVNYIVTGLAVILLSIPRGLIRERYGRWTAFIK